MTQTAFDMTENRERQKPVTLEDLAKIAGVHPRTVADALKGTGRVAPATRERVLRVASELRYVPNAAARALATGRAIATGRTEVTRGTGTVAVLSGPLNEHFYANMVHQLETHLTGSGYEMMLLHTRREVKELVQAAQASAVDGVIVIGTNHFAEEFHRVSPNSIGPCVFIDTSDPGLVDHLTLDLRPAVEEALHLMLDAGRQRIAYVVNNRDGAALFEVRMATYLQLMEQAGRSPEVIDVNTAMRPQERIQAVKTYIEKNGCPDALLCQNDETAIYTYRAVVALGMRLPEDVLLVGCDGLPYMEFFDPPLSTIALPTEEICALAARFLQARMAHPNIPIQQATLQGHLMIRRSLKADA